jgi:hypothetical protein
MIVITAAVFLPEIGKGIAKSTGLGQTFTGNIFIVLSTSLPERPYPFILKPEPHHLSHIRYHDDKYRSHRADIQGGKEAFIHRMGFNGVDSCLCSEYNVTLHAEIKMHNEFPMHISLNVRYSKGLIRARRRTGIPIQSIKERLLTQNKEGHISNKDYQIYFLLGYNFVVKESME